MDRPAQCSKTEPARADVIPEDVRAKANEGKTPLPLGGVGKCFCDGRGVAPLWCPKVK